MVKNRSFAVPFIVMIITIALLLAAAAFLYFENKKTQSALRSAQQNILNLEEYKTKANNTIMALEDIIAYPDEQNASQLVQSKAAQSRIRANKEYGFEYGSIKSFGDYDNN